MLRYKNDDLVIEKNSFDVLKASLGENIQATPEKCLADCGFSPTPTDTHNLQIQLKSSSNSLFCSTAGYNEMLLICRSIKYADLGWLCIPGKGLPNNVELSPNGKYGAFLVQTEEMNMFLSNLCEAIKMEKTEFVWPKGTEVDISSLLLIPFQSICLPHSKADRVEYEARTWRKSLFPNLRFTEAPYHGMHYDIVIEQIQVQDKTTKADLQSGRYPVSLSKSSGLTRGKLSTAPYCREDFQALCILTQDRNYIFLIPTAVLCAKGYIANDDSPGKTSLHSYSLDYVRPMTGRRPDTWTQQYCYRADDPELESKFKAALHDIAEHYRTQA